MWGGAIEIKRSTLLAVQKVEGEKTEQNRRGKMSPDAQNSKFYKVTVRC